MASSAPATSANVVLGVSLVTSLARDLPKFITREPPPCIWFMMNKKISTTTTIGRKLNSRLKKMNKKISTTTTIGRKLNSRLKKTFCFGTDTV